MVHQNQQFPSLTLAAEHLYKYVDKNGNKMKWEVVEDVAPSDQLDISKLKPRSFLKNGEKYITREEMRKRAVEFKGNLGLCDGKRMLAEQDKIPKEFRNFNISLPGTVLSDSSGLLYVPCLCYRGGRWYLDFCYIGIDWYGRDRFACSE